MYPADKNDPGDSDWQSDTSTLIAPPTPTTPTTPTTTTSTRPSRHSKLLLRRHLQHLQRRLHPLLSVANGQPHPAFPASILHYHLLTEAQLDALAHWYHQRTPGPWSFRYPAPVILRWDRQAHIEDKRRRFGRFIGLRGCESPVVNRVPRQRDRQAGHQGGHQVGRQEGEGGSRCNREGSNVVPQQTSPVDSGRSEDVDDAEMRDARTAEDIERLIERRVRRAMDREDEREMWRRKGF